MTVRVPPALSRALLVLLVLVLPRTGWTGWHVPHPEALLMLAQGVQLVELRLTIDRVVAEPCSGGASVVLEADQVLVHSPTQPALVTLPVGTFCSFDLVASEVSLIAERNGQELQVPSISLGTVSVGVTEPLTVDPQGTDEAVLELGHATLLDQSWGVGAVVVALPGDPVVDELEQVLATGILTP